LTLSAISATDNAPPQTLEELPSGHVAQCIQHEFGIDPHSISPKIKANVHLSVSYYLR
jgi:hypothetical protein